MDALEHASLTGELDPFENFMYERLDAALAEYVNALLEAQPQPAPR